MLFCAVLCCAVLCCAVLCCVVLCCAVLCVCCAVLCCIVLYFAVVCCEYDCLSFIGDMQNQKYVQKEKLLNSISCRFIMNIVMNHLVVKEAVSQGTSRVVTHQLSESCLSETKSVQ